MKLNTQVSMACVEGGLSGCIVVIAAFFIQVVVIGTCMCIGVYNVEFLDYFQSSATAVSLVGSINLGVLFVSSPLASILMTKWSCRQIALVGAALSNIGILTMPFAPNMTFMYVFYGIISGLGYGLLNMPSHVLSGLYFYKQRSLATGLATAGSGLGSSVFPVLFHYLIEHYGWRGSFYIVAGVNLHSFVFAALLRPVPDDLRIQLERKESADIRNQSAKYKPQIAITPEDIITGNSNENIEVTKDENEDKDKRTRLVNVYPSEQANDKDRKKNTVSEKLKNHLRSVFTFDFLVYCLSSIFWNAGLAILVIFLPKYMDTVGLNRQDASLAFTAIGIGSCLGCVAGGVLGNIKYFNRIILYIVSNFGISLTTMLMLIEYVHTFAGMFLMCLINGFQFGMILGLMVVVTSDLLGTESLGDGFGYFMFSNGVGMFAGPPLAGALIDATSDLGAGLIVSGLTTAVGGLSMCAVLIRRRISYLSLTAKKLRSG